MCAVLMATCTAAPGDDESIALATRNLCESAACRNVWLHPYPPHEMMVRGRDANSTDECFALINSTCDDCLRDYWTGACSHLLHQREPQPMSGRFKFCSGHTSHEMSKVAWIRFMTWRNEMCPGALDRSAWADAGSLRLWPEAFWLAYHKQGAPRWVAS